MVTSSAPRPGEAFSATIVERLFAAIKDGTSNTMAVAEYLKGMDSTDARGRFLYEPGRLSVPVRDPGAQFQRT